MSEEQTIYNNTSAFGLMPTKLQKQLQEHHRNGGAIELYTGRGWKRVRNPSLFVAVVFRAAPSYATIPWEEITRGWNWAATDKDGRGWLYNNKPILGDVRWCASVGGLRELSTFAGYTPSNLPWRDSLQARPVGV